MNQCATILVPRFALVAEHHPASAKSFGTPNFIKTLCASPIHPFKAIVVTDMAESNPMAGPWSNLPTLPLFRPRSILPKVGLGLLDNTFFALQSHRVFHFLEQHQIERLFIVLANNPRFAFFAAANLPTHLAKDIYLIDDFVEDSHLYRVRKNKAQWIMDKLVTESERVFTISSVCVADLEQTYRRSIEFLPILIPEVKLASMEPAEELRENFPQRIVIHHAGTIHHLYAEAMTNFILLIQQLAEQKSIEVTFEFCGEITLPLLEKIVQLNLNQLHPNLKIEVYGQVPLDELLRRQNQADFLLLVNSFSPNLKKQIRASFSSKVTEYLVSKTPILLYAPAYSSLAAYLSQYQAAHVISTEGGSEALQQLEAIISDPYRYRTVVAAQQLAKSYHADSLFFSKIVSTTTPEDIRDFQ